MRLAMISPSSLLVYLGEASLSLISLGLSVLQTNDAPPGEASSY